MLHNYVLPHTYVRDDDKTKLEWRMVTPCYEFSVCREHGVANVQSRGDGRRAHRRRQRKQNFINVDKTRFCDECSGLSEQSIKRSYPKIPCTCTHSTVARTWIQTDQFAILGGNAREHLVHLARLELAFAILRRLEFRSFGELDIDGNLQQATQGEGKRDVWQHT